MDCGMLWHRSIWGHRCLLTPPWCVKNRTRLKELWALIDYNKSTMYIMTKLPFDEVKELLLDFQFCNSVRVFVYQIIYSKRHSPHSTFSPAVTCIRFTSSFSAAWQSVEDRWRFVVLCCWAAVTSRTEHLSWHAISWHVITILIIVRSGVIFSTALCVWH